MDDELFYDAVDLLRRLIATPSVSRDESAAADIVADELRRHGFSPKRSANNVWAIDPDFDPAKPTVLFNSHIDTVKPVANWTMDPFTPTTDETGERLYGLGSNDAGASVVSLLSAFRHLTGIPRSYNLIFLASAEEEVSGRNGIESVLPMLPPIELAIVGEPTGMNPATAEKGLMVLDGEVTGKSGHAARNEGINAIYRAIDVIDSLRAMTFPKKSAMLGPVKLSVTQIEAGTQHNVVPDVCRFVVDVRTTDSYSNQQTLDMIRDAMPEYCTLTPRSTRLNPSGISREHPLVRRLEMTGAVPFGSPTLSDQALLHCPSLKLGPGDSARSHTADEYICQDEIRQAIATYIKIMSDLKL